MKKYRNSVLAIFFLCFSITSPLFSQEKVDEEKADQNNQQTKIKNIDDVIDVALDLDGELSYVEIEDSELLNKINGQVTVCAWIKPTNFPTRYLPIIYKGDERMPGITNRSFSLYLRHDGALQFASSPDGENEKYIFSPKDAVKLNQWHHVAGVIDTTRNTISVYVDGVETGYRDFGRNRRFYESILPLKIGGTHEETNHNHRAFVGQIDEVSVWDVALTEEQIYDFMDSRLTGNERGLVGYWKFDKQNDGEIFDMTHNKLNGKLVANARLVDYIRPIPKELNPEQLTEHIILYEKALKRGTNSYELYRTLAEIYVKTGQTAEAERLYLQSFEADLRQSEHDAAMKSLWQLYDAAGKEKEFITLMEKLKPKMKESSVLYQLLGDAYTKIDDKQNAEDAYSQWISMEKDEALMQNQPSTYYELADKLLQRNILPETALELILRAAETEWDRDFMLVLAHAYVANEQYDNAFQLIRNIYDTSFAPFVERRLLARVVKAGKHVQDKEGYVDMLNDLMEFVSDNLPSRLPTTLALAQFYQETAEYEKADALKRETGFITEESWMVLGPFDNVGGIGYNTQYIPENLPMIDKNAEYHGKHGKIKWQKLKDDTVYGDIRFGKPVEWSVTYAFAIIHSPEERDVDFRFDSDDQGKVWVNGMEVFTHTKTFSAEIDHFKFPVKLNPGINSVLVKVCEETDGTGFYLRITDKDGNTFDDLDFMKVE